MCADSTHMCVSDVCRTARFFVRYSYFTGDDTSAHANISAHLCTRRISEEFRTYKSESIRLEKR